VESTDHRRYGHDWLATKRCEVEKKGKRNREGDRREKKKREGAPRKKGLLRRKRVRGSVKNVKRVMQRM
jgi:hypothetical protein